MNISIRLVVVLMLIATAVIIGFDILVASDSVDNNTISEIMARASIKLPIIPFAWGALMSHFFFTRKWKPYTRPEWWYWNVRQNRYYYLALSCIAVIILGLTGVTSLSLVPFYFLLGMSVGYELFPQFKENM